MCIVMTVQQALDMMELIRSKYRYYGKSLAFLDSSISSFDDYLVFSRLGLAVIESIASPADAYYIQRVVFPAFVKRVFPFECDEEVDYSFEGWLAKLKQAAPQFYFDITVWPASTR